MHEIKHCPGGVGAEGSTARMYNIVTYALAAIVILLTIFDFAASGIGRQADQRGYVTPNGKETHLDGDKRAGDESATRLNPQHSRPAANTNDDPRDTMTPIAILRSVWRIAIEFIKLAWITTALIGLTSRLPARYRISNNDGMIFLAGWNSQWSPSTFGRVVAVLGIYVWLMTAGAPQLVEMGDSYCKSKYPALQFVPKHGEGPHKPGQNICPVPANGDVAGVGVRIATYVIQFCLLVITCFKPQRTAARLRSQGQTLSGIIVLATLACSFLRQISLPHALIALGMTTISIWPAFLVEPIRDGSAKSLVLAKVRFMAYSIVCFWLNVAPTCYGSSHSCNYATTRFIVGWVGGHMAVNPMARANWLRFHSTVIVFACCRLLMYPGMELWENVGTAAKCAQNSRGWTNAETTGMKTELEHWGQGAGRFRMVMVRWLFDTSPAPPMPWFAYGDLSWQKRTRIFLTNHNFVRFVLASAMMGFLIGGNEFTVVWNLGQWENRSWGYGQTLACAQAVEFFYALVDCLVHKDKLLVDCWKTGAFDQAHYDAVLAEAERELREIEAAEREARREARRRHREADPSNNIPLVSVNTTALESPQNTVRSRASSAVTSTQGDGVSVHAIV